MASVVKRGKTWQYTVSQMVEGKYSPIRKGGFTTKKEATVAAAEVEAGLAKGISPIAKHTSFAAYFLEWINLYKKNKHPTTYKRYLASHDSVLNYFGDRTIQTINKASYQLFLNEYAENHAKDTTRKLNTHIRACVKDAVDDGQIRVDFTRKSELSGKNASKRPEEKHLNFDEGKALLNTLYNRLDDSIINYFLLLGLTSGMRFGEMAGITRGDFDFANGTVRINKTWDYKNNGGFEKTKGNGESDRTIAMDRKVMSAFESLFKKTPAHYLGLVFHNPQSKYGVLTNVTVNRALQQILMELGANVITAHGLRHSHTSILLYSGVSVLYVSERLGHANPQITTEIYSHIIKELREKDELLSKEVFSNMRVVNV